MKAAVFYGKKEIRVEEREVRALRPDEILIDVKAAGICGTDVHIYNGNKGATDCNPPVVLGHELAGVVREVGSAVKRIKVGDRVCVDPNVTCGECEMCRKGDVHFCDSMYATGVNYDGGFGQQCIVLEKQAYLLADSVSFEAGAMCEPLACCLHGFDLANVKMGDRVLIIGGGTIGLIMLQLCKTIGATRIAVSEPDQSKHSLALELGADCVIDPLKENVIEVLKRNDMAHIDVVIECVGRVNTMEDAVKYAGKGASIMLFGLGGPDDVIKIKPFDVFRKELKIMASYINPLTQGRAADLLNSGKLNLDKLVGAVIPLEGLAEALESPSKVGKVIVRP